MTDDDLDSLELASVLLPPFVRFHDGLCVSLHAIDAIAVHHTSTDGHASIVLRSGLAFPAHMTIEDALDRVVEACFDPDDAEDDR